MVGIEFKNIYKSFGSTKVIQNLNLTIQDGKFTVLVGPSGCGKTTLLRMIAGIGLATSGNILMEGRDITDLAPGKRDIAMVFQNYAIYPTMTVRENIEFGLKNNRVPKEERDRLIKEVADTVNLSEYLDRKPGTLSGGQRQRVALARAMVKKPKVFLMDEPLSNLDAKLRVQMRVELIELHEKLKTTFVYVTHDQVEAMSMADVIVLMDKGEIQQEGTPEEIYYDPNNTFIAQFIGSPAMNLLEGPDGVKLGFRPEKAIISGKPAADAKFRRAGRVSTREMLGSETIYKIAMEPFSAMVKSMSDNFAIGDDIVLSVGHENLYFFGSDGERMRGASLQLYKETRDLAEEMSNV
jgi:sn-glycerol 3-phosphate transport system ATP-binding protein